MKALLFIILMDVLGTSIFVPLITLFPIEFGVTPSIATLLVSLYPISAAISAPLIGRLSDDYGRKKILSICLLGSIIGFLLLAFCDSVINFIFIRIFQGIMSGSIAVAIACIIDKSDEEERTSVFALIGMTVGIAFVVGPVIGSLLAGKDFTKINFQTPALLAAALSFIAYIAVYRMNIDENNSCKKKQKSIFSDISNLIKKSAIFSIVGIFLFNFSEGIGQTILSVWSQDVGIMEGPAGLAPIFVSGGILISVLQATGVSRLAKRFTDWQIVKIGAALQVVGWIGVSGSGELGNYSILVLSMSFVACGMPLITTPLQSIFSKSLSKEEFGIGAGFMTSITTIGRVVGTIISGTIYVTLYKGGIFHVCAVIGILILLVAILATFYCSIGVIRNET